MDLTSEENVIKPTYYYENGGVPVFTPTMEQFKDFRKYVQAIDSYGQKSGIVKVIPPKEWRDSVAEIPKEKLAGIHINSSIKQTFVGQGGHWVQYNTGYNKKMDLKDWKDLCYSEECKTPTIFDRNVAVNTLGVKRKRSKSQAEQPAPIESEGSVVPEATLAKDSTSKAAVESGKEVDGKENCVVVAAEVKREDFMPYAMPKYSNDFYHELERIYWKNLSFGSSFYGADIPGTLFADDMDIWNVAKLDNILNKLNKKVLGVTSPYLYFGMYKATFAWHLEDMDLYSINYIHFGAPKQWFVIPPEHCSRFFDLAKSMFPALASKCSEFLRHKMIMISPTQIEQSGIPVHRCVQEAGEFMITFPYGYHAGYNIGYNCAESTNFALERWIEIGRKANPCKCVSHSVRIDVEAVFGPPPKEKCILCGRESVLKHAEKFIEVFDYINENELKRIAKSHVLCAQSIPELTIKPSSNNNKKIVSGYSNIPSDRFKMKCKFCDYKNGACIQCAKGRCLTSYHPSCAIENGLMLQIRTSEDGVQYAESFCSRHDPRMEADKRKDYESMVAKITEFIDRGSRRHVWARWSDKQFYEGRILEDIREKHLCRVSFPDGYQKAVLYEDLRLEQPN